jgi:hypothetical protein
MLVKSYFLGLCFLFLEGCTQPSIGWSHISCDGGLNKMAPYSLESLGRSYECKENQKEYK